MFPAAANIETEGFKLKTEKISDGNSSIGLPWLQNESYNAENKSEIISNKLKSSIQQSDEDDQPKKKHKKKEKKEKKREKSKEVEAKRVKHLTKTKVFLDDIPGVSQEDAYHIDRESNPNILIYGGLYEGHVAKYRPTVYSTLGMKRFNPYPKDKNQRKLQREKRYFSKTNRRQLKKQTHVLDLSRDSNLRQGDLSPEARCVPLPFDLEEGGSVAKETGMCHVEGSEGEIVELVAKYNRAVHSNPRDIESWIKLIDLQARGAALLAIAAEAVVGKDEEHEKPAVGRSKKMNDIIIVEKQMAILQRAIAGNPGSLQLKLLQLDFANDIWEAEKLAQEWTQLTFTHPNDLMLWRRHLTFLNERYRLYATSRMVDVYAKCFTTLNEIITGRMVSHRLRAHTMDDLIEFFSDYCHWLRANGQSERAFASWQAIIEFNCFRPIGRKISVSGEIKSDPLVVAFEAFWVSGCSKFGEPESRGWAAWEENSTAIGSSNVRAGLCDRLQNAAIEAEEFVILRHTVEQLGQAVHFLERSREALYWLPWQPHDGSSVSDLEDPDRTVLFDDVSCCLLDLHAAQVEGSERLCQRLVLLFLDFLGVKDVGVAEEYGLPRESIILAELHALPTKHRTQLTSTTLVNWEPDALSTIIDNVLEQGQTLYDVTWKTTLTQQELDRLASGNAKTVAKRGKKILARDHNRSALRAWRAYACALWRCGDLVQARRVLGATLVMHPLNADDVGRVVPAVEVLDVLDFIRTYIDLELGICDGTTRTVQSQALDSYEEVTALHLLVYASLGGVYQQSNSSPVSGTQLVKARHILAGWWTSLREAVLSNDASARTLTIVAYLYAILRLLTEGELEMQTVLESTVTTLLPHQEPLCQFLSWSCAALVWHCRRSHQGPRTIQQLLSLALPNILDRPSLLVHLLTGSTSLPGGMVLFGPMRQAMDAVVEGSKSFGSWIVLLSAELSRWEAVAQLKPEGAELTMLDATTTRRIRSLFERGLARGSAHGEESMGFRTQLTLRMLWWRAYLSFEYRLLTDVSQSDVRQRVKGIFYRAVQDCPWAKCLYFDLIRYFPEDVEEVTDVLREKDLRLRAPFEEVDLLLRSKEETSAVEESV